MKKSLQAISLRLLLVVSAFVAVLWSVGVVWSMQKPTEMERLIKQMKTVCASERNLLTGYAFYWETQGTTDNLLRPFVSLELQTGMSRQAGGKPAQSTLSEAALADLWRRMSSSLRLRRPAALAPVTAGATPPA